MFFFQVQTREEEDLYISKIHDVRVFEMQSKAYLNLAENPAYTQAVKTYTKAREQEVIDEDTLLKLLQWEARLHEARSFLALAKVELENHGLGPFLPALIIFQWGFLKDRGLRPEIVCGFMSYETDSGAMSVTPDFVVPTLWIEIQQPVHLIPAMQKIWGTDHARSAETMMCDLSGVTAWLREGIVLGQVLRPGIDDKTRIRYWRTQVAPFPKDKATLCQTQLHNWEFIAAYPDKYFKFGMEQQLRKQILQAARKVQFGDPGRVQYFDAQTATSTSSATDISE